MMILTYHGHRVSLHTGAVGDDSTVLCRLGAKEEISLRCWDSVQAVSLNKAAVVLKNVSLKPNPKPIQSFGTK